MTLSLLCFAIGIITVGYLPELPSFSYCLFSLPLIFFLKKNSILFYLCVFLLGLSYGIVSGNRYLSNQLASELEGQELVVEGRVIDLPEENSRRQSFELSVDQAYIFSTKEQLLSYPSRIKITSYNGLRVQSGEEWRFLVVLKKPRGFVNPTGFDYHVSLLRKSIGATGSIKVNKLNERLATPSKFSMDYVRYELQHWLLSKSNDSARAILIALLVGDTSYLERAEWDKVQKTGTSHLIAISGLHLGFFAIVGYFIGNFLGRFVQLFWHRCPSMVFGYFFAIFFTLFYSIIAGFNIPTLRTLIMLSVVQWVYLWRRSFRGRDTLLLALVLVLLYDPLAAFDIGFWLSFLAVGMLLFCFSGRVSVRNLPTFFLEKSIMEFIKSQWVMFVGLLIPLAIFIHSTPLLAPIANIVAIPLITFFVVPSLILAAFGHYTFLPVEHLCLFFAEQGISLFQWWINFLLKFDSTFLNPMVNFNPSSLVLAVLGVFILLLPRGITNRWIGFAGILCAVAIPLNSLPALQMMVFDVGQGTSILIRTPKHQLLYDAGPRYTEQFDAGSALVVPYLKSQGIEYLDAIVVSHSDQDHSGGLAGVLSNMQVDELWLGEVAKYENNSESIIAASCHEVPAWQWEGIHFRFINWVLDESESSNNHSCILEIEYNGHKILLAGDIEKPVEKILIEENKLESVEVLLAPHHGSHTSSSHAFVMQTKPRYVIYSAGYRNQHGHPHEDIQARYLAVKSTPLNTALSGAIEFEWDQGALRHVHQHRIFSKRYWYDEL